MGLGLGSRARRLRSPGLLVVVGLLASCGYHFSAREDALPTDGRPVFAPTFANNTTEPGVEVLLTDAFRAELANAHADGSSDAPIVAKGEVTSLGGGVGQVYAQYNPEPRPSDQKAIGLLGPANYRVDLGACVRLMEGPKELGASCVSGSEDYLPGRDPLEVEAARRLAIRRLAKRLMHEAFEHLSNRF